jgi:proline iminopeptidase
MALFVCYDTSMNISEGFAAIAGNKIWYAVYGDLKLGNTPLIGLHGGPAWPHYSLLPLSELADKGIPVVLYDQLGSGKSDRPDDPRLWTIEAYVNELDELREHLGLDTVNLLGHSWGGTLAIEYVLKHPGNVEKLILNSPLIDTQLWISEADKLKDELPSDTARIMREHEKNGTTNDPEYEQAYKTFQQNFVCRIVPQPPEYDLADAEWGKEVYQYMWGPSEAFATGTLKDYSAIEKLPAIKQQTLIISGKYDEATPAQMSILQKALPDAMWECFENSAHSALFEERSRYLNTVFSFLQA